MKSKLIAVSEIPAQGTRKIDFFGREVLVYKEGDAPRAVLNYCTHLGGPLEMKDGGFTCGWHGAQFSCAGQCTKGPAAPESRLMFVPTRVEGGDLFYVSGE